MISFKATLALCRKGVGPGMLSRSVGEQDDVTAVRIESATLGKQKEHRGGRPPAREPHNVRQRLVAPVAVDDLQHAITTDTERVEEVSTSESGSARGRHGHPAIHTLATDAEAQAA